MDYKFKVTSKIKSLARQLNQASFFIRQFPLDPQKSSNIRQQSILHSSLFSARIEGNHLSLDQVSNLPIRSPKDHQKLEIQNLLSAHNYIYSSRPPKKLTFNLIKKLHQLAMRQLTPAPGEIRTEQTAIFNSAGVAIYLTPPPDQIKPKLNDLFIYSNRRTHYRFTQVAVSHFAFEKIHPFIDGNGRIGRLITQFQLDRNGKNFCGLLAFEKHLDQFRSEYYSLLNQQKKDIAEFVEFYLEMISLAASDAVDQLKTTPKKPDPLDSLLPRRKEIYLLFKDHTYLSFDQIHRRFLAVNQSTLRNDIRQLIKQGLIKKIGSTKGAFYQVA